MHRLLSAKLVCLTVAALLAAGPALAVDHGLWDDLVSRRVHGGRVDYMGLRTEEAKLDRYLALLEETDHQALSPPERFAFFINAYNAWTVKLILSRTPLVDSIKDFGGLFTSPWELDLVRLKDGVYTLDQVEHDILRKEFNDPRVHFVINCASKGCPPLGRGAYRAEDLDMSLNRAASGFINDPAYNRLDGNVLYISKIFDWYEDDLGDPVDYILKYAKGGLKNGLVRNRADIDIKFIPYDWSLNVIDE